MKATRVVGTYGAYRPVRARSAARLYGTVRPYHVGQCVRFRIQQPRSGTWAYNQPTPCARLGVHSRTYIRFDSSWRPRDRVRVRVLWDGDRRNAKAHSRWLYLRFVS